MANGNIADTGEAIAKVPVALIPEAGKGRLFRRHVHLPAELFVSGAAFRPSLFIRLFSVKVIYFAFVLLPLEDLPV